MTTRRSLQQDISDFHRQLKKGAIQRAYRGLIAYMMGLRTHFAKKHGDSAVSGVYQGYMDMTYFALFPTALKRRGLKLAIVFNFDAFRFEAWLSGRNRKIQTEYWKRLKNGRWNGYRVVAPAEGVDSILESDLATAFDLDHPDGLTVRIEKGTKAFTEAIEKFLANDRSA